VVGILILALAAGCDGLSTRPATVQPTLDAIESLGMRCGDGVRDNVPSGLSQWSCTGSLDGASSTLLVDGNAEGVAGITLVVDGPVDAATTRQRFGLVVDGV